MLDVVQISIISFTVIISFFVVGNFIRLSTLLNTTDDNQTNVSSLVKKIKRMDKKDKALKEAIKNVHHETEYLDHKIQKMMETDKNTNNILKTIDASTISQNTKDIKTNMDLLTSNTARLTDLQKTIDNYDLNNDLNNPEIGLNTSKIASNALDIQELYKKLDSIENESIYEEENEYIYEEEN